MPIAEPAIWIAPKASGGEAHQRADDDFLADANAEGKRANHLPCWRRLQREQDQRQRQAQPNPHLRGDVLSTQRGDVNHHRHNAGKSEEE